MKNLSFNVIELNAFNFETDLIDEVVEYQLEGLKVSPQGKSYSHFLDSNVSFDDYKTKIATTIEGISNCGFYSDIKGLVSQEINNGKLAITCLGLTKKSTIRIGKLITRNENILEFLNAIDDQVTVLNESYRNWGSKRIKVPNGLNTILRPYLKFLSFGLKENNAEETFQYAGKEIELNQLHGELNYFYIKSKLDEFKAVLGYGPYCGPIIWLGSDGKSSALELLYFIMKLYDFDLIIVKRDKNGQIRPNYNLIKRCFVKNDLSEFNENFKSLKQQLNNLSERKRIAIDNILSNYK